METFRLTLVILLFTLIARILAAVFIDHIPCMDPLYLSLASKLVSEGQTPINLSPAYALFLYAANWIFKDPGITSKVLFIIFSTLTSYFIYKIAKILFNGKVANIALLITIFLPNFTVAVAGYSHTTIIALCLELISIYFTLCYLSEGKVHFGFFSILFGILCILIRPENLLVLSLLNGFIVLLYIKKGKLTNKSAFLFFSSTILFFAVITFAHGYFLKQKSSSPYKGTFTDSRYSYFAYIHTYSLRFHNTIKDDLAIKESTPLIGSPESNNYSMMKAAMNNPVQTILNLLFNAKELLKTMAHPLFIPFYFYFFMGLILIGWQRENFPISLAILLVLCLLHIIPLLVFHVEIRYMQPLAACLIIMISYGLNHLNSKFLYVSLALTTFITFALFLMYLINNAKLESLCG